MDDMTTFVSLNLIYHLNSDVFLVRAFRRQSYKVISVLKRGKMAISNESISKTSISRARQFRKIKRHMRFFCHMIFGNLSWELCEFSPLN